MMTWWRGLSKICNKKDHVIYVQPQLECYLMLWVYIALLPLISCQILLLHAHTSGLIFSLAILGSVHELRNELLPNSAPAPRVNKIIIGRAPP